MAQKRVNISIPSSEITPKSLFLSRRDWLKMMGIVSAASLLTACGASTPEAVPSAPPDGAPSGPAAPTPTQPADIPTTREDITGYANYYEFTTDKGAVKSLSADFRSSPWSVEVGGLVHNPRTYSPEDFQRFEQVERVYRLRCVEAWSMVIPWNGFELNQLLAEAEPMTSAKYVKFTTLFDPEQYPGQNSSLYPWPYTEGLRLDEALHPLTLIATGLYGESLPNPNGPPLRLVVPWKYGFKSIKAIVKIELTETQPPTLWNTIAPQEYGFYANVNPDVDHPRWSQRTERRIGELKRRDTLMFNGYANQVAFLYSDMDLSIDY
jgi:methionine sulfoxide reductase catalytic subunit